MRFIPKILSDMFAGSTISAASQLAVVAPPKVKPGQMSFPSFLRTASKTSTAQLPRRDLALAATDMQTFRDAGNTRKVVQQFATGNADLSASVFAYLRTAITKDYVAVAKNMDGTFNPDATNLLQQVLTRFDVVGDYTEGFSGIASMRANSESLGKEILFYGSCALELVLGKDRLPYALRPISVTTIEFLRDDKDPAIKKPRQRVAGQIIDLDIPTFFYTALDQDLLEPYSDSPLQSAIQPVQFATEFMNDLRRVVQKAIHPRLMVKIAEEAIKKSLPPEAFSDKAALDAYRGKIIADVATQINNLKIDDALVLSDAIEAEYMTGGNTSLSSEYTVLAEIINSKLATGAKTMPSILGMGSGSQNIASTETMLFLKNADGAMQQKLNEIYSQALTLAMRLFGLDVYVSFKYGDIDIRPEAELEAFRVMRQSRKLELLSLGLITDEEAALDLTGHLPPLGYKPLTGTGFYTKQPLATDNGYTNQSSGGGGGGAGTQKNNEPATGQRGSNKK